MIALAEFKQILGADAEGLSDEEILEIRDALQSFADLALDIVIAERRLQ